MKKLMVLTTLIITLLSITTQAAYVSPFVTASGNSVEKQQTILKNYKVTSSFTRLQLRQTKGTAKFTKWKRGYGTVVTSKKIYGVYKVVIKDHKGSTQAKYMTGASLNISLKKGSTYTVTITYDRNRTVKKYSNWLNGTFEQWNKNSSWMVSLSSLGR